MSTLNLFDSQSLFYPGQIDWEILANQMAHFCLLESNKESLYQISAILDLESISRFHQHIEKYQKLIPEDEEKELSLALSYLSQDQLTEDNLLYLSKGGIPPLVEINRIVCLLEFAHNYLPYLKGFSLNEDVSTTIFHRRLISPFRQFVSPDGKIDYLSHPELKAIYEKINLLDQHALSLLSRIIQNFDRDESLSFSSHDILDNRYVIPLKTDHYQAKYGRIVKRSDSGRTLYIEPVELIALSEKRELLQQDFENVLQSLCALYSRLITDDLSLVENIFSSTLYFDQVRSRYHFCFEKNFCKPTIKKNPQLVLSDIWNPLLENSVKNDIEMKSKQILVISGPNTGGKTVFLKSLCLAHIFFWKGYYINAKVAEIYPFQKVFYLGSDNQNLSAGLSSFAGEAESYIKLLSEIDEPSLILVDEIFNSTTSEDASVLAISIMKEIIKKSKTYIVVSTHHQLLKAKAHLMPECESAHVGFDPKTLKPTYKIHFGSPGSSYAITIFKNISPAYGYLADYAESLIEAKTREYESLLYQLSQKQSELDTLVSSNKQLQEKLQNMAGSQEGILKLKTEKEIEQLKLNLEKIKNRALDYLESLKSTPEVKPTKVHNFFHDITPKYTKVNSNTNVVPIPVDQLQEGQMYFCDKLNTSVELLQIKANKKSCKVRSKVGIVEVPTDSLFHGNKKNFSKPKENFHLSIEKSENSQLYLDARGMRLDEFENSFEKMLSSLLIGEIPFLEVIHGNGDGILKSWLRNVLKKRKDISWEIPEHSHDGSTKIFLS